MEVEGLALQSGLREKNPAMENHSNLVFAVVRMPQGLSGDVGLGIRLDLHGALFPVTLMVCSPTTSAVFRKLVVKVEGLALQSVLQVKKLAAEYHSNFVLEAVQRTFLEPRC